jgi:hypothetical protein
MVLSMPVRRFFKMKKQISRIKAEESLRMVNAIICPNLKEEARRNMIDRLIDAADPYRKEREDLWWKNPPKGLQLVTTGETNKIIGGKN